jgi:hypothetical protein
MVTQAPVVFKGDVLAVTVGESKVKKTPYKDVTILVKPKNGSPQTVTIRCWNGGADGLVVGKPGELAGLVQLQAGGVSQSTGRAYGASLSLVAF